MAASGSEEPWGWKGTGFHSRQAGRASDSGEDGRDCGEGRGVSCCFRDDGEVVYLQRGPTKDGIDAIVDKSSQLRPQPQSQQIEELERCCCLAPMAHVTMHGWPAIGQRRGWQDPSIGGPGAPQGEGGGGGS